MLNYDIPVRKGKVTAAFWAGLMRDFERREGREGTCLYWREKSPLPSFSVSLSLSFAPDLRLPGGLTGRWKRLYRNNKPWKEKPWEKRRDDRGGGGGGRSREIFGALTGQHTCPSGPGISACTNFHHLDGSDLHRITRERKWRTWALNQRYAALFPEMWDLWSQLD